MVWFSKITHIQLIASKKDINGTCDTKLRLFFIHEFILKKAENLNLKII